MAVAAPGEGPAEARGDEDAKEPVVGGGSARVNEEAAPQVPHVVRVAAAQEHHAAGREAGGEAARFPDARDGSSQELADVQRGDDGQGGGERGIVLLRAPRFPFRPARRPFGIMVEDPRVAEDARMGDDAVEPGIAVDAGNELPDGEPVRRDDVLVREDVAVAGKDDHVDPFSAERLHGRDQLRGVPRRPVSHQRLKRPRRILERVLGDDHGVQPAFLECRPDLPRATAHGVFPQEEGEIGMEMAVDAEHGDWCQLYYTIK